jgi:hypothetical protein
VGVLLNYHALAEDVALQRAARLHEAEEWRLARAVVRPAGRRQVRRRVAETLRAAAVWLEPAEAARLECC